MNNSEENEIHGNTVEGTVSSSTGALQKFLINYNGKMGVAVFCAKRSRITDRNAELKACGVRDPSLGTVANILCFQYDLPSDL